MAGKNATQHIKCISGMSLCHDLGSTLLCHILFLQVSESSSPHEASIQSSYFPAPVSTAACQVSY